MGTGGGRSTPPKAEGSIIHFWVKKGRERKEENVWFRTLEETKCQKWILKSWPELMGEHLTTLKMGYREINQCINNKKA